MLTKTVEMNMGHLVISFAAGRESTDGKSVNISRKITNKDDKSKRLAMAENGTRYFINLTIPIG